RPPARGRAAGRAAGRGGGQLYLCAGGPTGRAGRADHRVHRLDHREENRLNPRTQQDRSRATRAALVATARGLFAERGYAGVSADDIVSAAGLTRGALHHHFGDKAGLFRAVFEQLEAEITAELTTALEATDDSLAGMAAGLGAFLDICQRPEVLRIGLTDAPTVLGWETWR